MQRYFAKEKNNNDLILFESDLHHINNVMRNKEGDLIEVVYDNTIYVCEIASLIPLSLNIVRKLDENNELKINLTIAIALVNEQKMDLILQKLTELGVSRIIPIKTERSIVKLDDKKETKKIIRWQMICKEASEQSKRSKIPQIANIMNIKELSKLKIENKFLCSLNENTKQLSYYFKQKPKDVLIAIGPEGGFTLNEEKLLIDNNFLPISLGKRVLRVETAAIYIASIINYIYEG